MYMLKTPYRIIQLRWTVHKDCKNVQQHVLLKFKYFNNKIIKHTAKKCCILLGYTNDDLPLTYNEN